MSALDEAAIVRALGELGAPETRVVVHAVTGSTNDDARALLAEGCASGTVIVADAQRAGRGRGGNVWQSPPGQNLYFSLALRGSATATHLPPFALVVGLSIVEELGEAFGVRAKLKWPNDVWIDGLKVAGVLIEALHRSGTPPALIVGAGINVNQATFPPDLAATSIARHLGSDVRREALVAALAVRISRNFDLYESKGYRFFHDRIARADALRDREVAIDDVRGRAVGIDEGGCLLVATGEGVVSVGSGHVALR